MKRILLQLEDKEFKKLENTKELMLILEGKKRSWEQFFIALAQTFDEENDR